MTAEPRTPELEEAWAAFRKAQEASDEARVFYDQTWAALVKARAAEIKARAALYRAQAAPKEAPGDH